MPYKVLIPITDSQCATSFGVEIKRQSDSLYQPLPDQFSLPIVVEDLESSVDYDARITRRCCDGTFSDPVVVQITGMVAQPINVSVTDQGGGDVYAFWEESPLADSYAAERSLTPGFETPDSVYSGTDLYFYDSPGIGTFYYRVWAIQTGKVNSTPVVVSITTV